MINLHITEVTNEQGEKNINMRFDKMTADELMSLGKVLGTMICQSFPEPEKHVGVMLAVNKYIYAAAGMQISNMIGRNFEQHEEVFANNICMQKVEADAETGYLTNTGFTMAPTLAPVQ